jgi:methionyl-tRNA synthetase
VSGLAQRASLASGQRQAILARMSIRLYVTTPIFYVNDKPHIGHAYCTILADTLARYARLNGAETYFLTGTDEHGQKVQQAAEKRGVTPQQHVDELSVAFRELWPTLHCEPDRFIRTTEPAHKHVVQRALWQLYDAGLIVERTFEGWYCVPDERFWTEKELVEGNCPDCGRPVTRLQERNWFFLMSQFQDQLIAAVQTGEMAIVPANRANEVLGFLREPLQDLCISRPKSRLSWGIELPFDTDFVAYVWFDALLNYVTALAPELPAPTPEDHALTPYLLDHDAFQKWWPHVTHCLGKDILTTHAVYWPTMLLALGLPVPRRLVTTGWWLMGDAKMSKSVGNVVDPHELRDKYGADVMRYFFLREMAVGQDSNFSEEAIVRRNNADLANDLGNLLQRVIGLCVRAFEGKIPEATREPSHVLADALIYAQQLQATERMGEFEPVAVTSSQARLHRTIADTMVLTQKLNGVLTSDAPFKAVFLDREAAATTLHHVLQGIVVAAKLLAPVIPGASAEMLRRMRAESGTLQSGMQLLEGPPLFPKHEWKNFQVITGEMLPVTDVVKDVKAKPGAAEVTSGKGLQDFRTGEFRSLHEPANLVDIETFARSQLRVGLVLSAEPVAKSKKLLCLSLDLGEGHPRQILSGIAETIAPADLVGKQVLVIANLPPRQMMGMESHGMLLVAEDAEGKRVPLHPAREVANGSLVK